MRRTKRLSMEAHPLLIFEEMMLQELQELDDDDTDDNDDMDNVFEQMVIRVRRSLKNALVEGFYTYLLKRFIDWFGGFCCYRLERSI